MLAGGLQLLLCLLPIVQEFCTSEDCGEGDEKDEDLLVGPAENLAGDPRFHFSQRC